MALHLSNEIIEFRFRDTGQRMVVQARFIRAMATLVKLGEQNAITQAKALKTMGVTNTDAHRRQWRSAADYWQEQGVPVSATTNGYFLIDSDEARARCVEFKQVTMDALERRKWRLKQIPLGKGFPQSV